MSDNLSQNSGIEFKPHPRIEDNKLDDKYGYTSNHPNMAMNRADGKRIVFVNGFFETDESGDKDYLDHEIDVGKNIFVRRATAAEMRTAHMRINPTAVAIEDVKNDPDFMEQLKAQLRAELINSGEYQPVNLGGKDVIGAGQIKTDTATVTLDDTAANKLAALKAGMPDRLTPVSTNDLAEGGAGESNSGQVAVVK